MVYFYFLLIGPLFFCTAHPFTRISEILCFAWATHSPNSAPSRRPSAPSFNTWFL